MKREVIFSCGHTGKVEVYGTQAAIEKKLEWLADHGLCKECYKQKERSEGVVLNYKIGGIWYPRNFLHDGGELFLGVDLWLSGDSYSYKDTIKTYGYFWGEFVGCPDNKQYWHKRIPISTLDNEIENISNFLSKIIDHTTNTDYRQNALLSEYIQIYNKKIKEIAAEKKEAIDKLYNPVQPNHINDKWNGKVYGAVGKHYIYIDNVKKYITDTQVAELEQDKCGLAKFNKEKDAIQSTFRTQEKEAHEQLIAEWKKILTLKGHKLKDLTDEYIFVNRKSEK